ncbi:CLL4A clavata1-like receptor S/T protein kinase protein [Planoprotostelium fungivorum]|uniref:CLL4A clavata1-like receptor S/T protein kinase protein n=1 Tax=Planoprotostelium fungivorum TaxID=1890364 RepID=A0A2P6NMM8_9EUKA|nr:CLL4A clavata1-like receptor S/T protein kinase protein [Planoprotostelium fungivorum]
MKFPTQCIFSLDSNRKKVKYGETTLTFEPSFYQPVPTAPRVSRVTVGSIGLFAMAFAQYLSFASDCEFLDVFPIPVPHFLRHQGVQHPKFEAESVVVRSLYDSLDGDHWVDNTNWKNATASYCSYYGISCDADGHVNRIVLSYNNLVGPLPNLSGLSHLVHLDLSGAIYYHQNFINGPFPDWITSTQLNYIDFEDHQFSGTLPDDLGNLVNLTWFDIGVNSLAGALYGPVPSSWMKLTKMQFFGLWGNGFDHINLTGLNDMIDLFYFDIGSCAFQGNFTDMVGAEIRLPKLTTFIVGSNGFYGPLPNLRYCENLLYYFAYTNSFDGHFPEWVTSSPNIIRISIDANLLTGPIPASISQMKKLDQLTLSVNNFNGELPDVWDQMPLLNRLLLFSNNFTGQIPPSMYRSVNLQYLQLSINQLTGSISPEIKNLKKLQFFNVNSNLLNGNLPDELYNCTNLIQLQLDTNQFTGDISDGLSQLTRLQSLTLGHNSFTGNIPDAFRSMNNLQLIDVSFNKFSGPFPSSLSNVTSLIYVKANDNELSGPMPSLSSSVLRLQIQRNRLNGTVFWMSGLLNLQLIDISYNEFSGPCSSLNGFNYMTYCDWSNNRLTGKIPTGYTEKMPLYHLDLSSNQLVGAMEYTIARLGSLSYLNLSRNELFGSVEPRLAQMSTLQYIGAIGLPQLIELRLDNNRLTGNIPSSVRRASSLTTLSLGNNLLSGGLQDVFSSPNLISLNVSGNLLDGEIPDVTGTTLQSLDLSHNRLEGILPGGFAKQMNLRVLSLSHNRLTGDVPYPLKSDPQTIDLSANRLSGPLNFLDTLSSLSHLNLSGNTFSGPIKTLNGMKGLSTVDISRNSITSLPSLSGLFNLEYFNASYNSINGSVPDLTDCYSLSTIDLSHNLLIDAMLMKDVPSLSQCDLTHQTFVCPLTSQASQLCGAVCHIDNYQSANLTMRIAGDVSTFDSNGFVTSIASLSTISRDRVNILRTRSVSVIVENGASAYSSKNITLLSVSTSITPDSPSSSNGLSGGAIAGIVIGVLVIVIVVLIVLLKRKKPVYKTNFELVDFTRIDNNSTAKSVIPFSELEDQVMIGFGAYGVVYKAKWRSNTVAVRNEHINTDQMQSFLGEASLVQRMRPHPNVVLFMGYTVPPDPLSIITEFCEGGCLLDYLAEHGSEVTDERRDNIILPIAKGVLHLHQEKMIDLHHIIHRDLAARNILLSRHLEAKVSDFGMSRQVQQKDSASTTSSTIGPIRWMTPEAITNRVQCKIGRTVTSIAFSFGVVIWEILTGQEPYSDIPLVEVAIRVINGTSLDIPEDANPMLRAIMKGVDATARRQTRFVQICNWLSEDDAVRVEDKLARSRVVKDEDRYEPVNVKHLETNYTTTAQSELHHSLKRYHGSKERSAPVLRYTLNPKTKCGEDKHSCHFTSREFKVHSKLSPNPSPIARIQSDLGF